MDSTTKMLVDQIVARGWYEASQCLGEGGWPAVHKWFEYKKLHYIVTASAGDGLTSQYTVYATGDEAIKNYIAEKFIPEAQVRAFEVVTEYRDVVL